MKPVLCVSLLFAVCALADDAADRIAIEREITSLNATGSGPDAKSLTTLFTSDADPAEIERLADMQRQVLEISNRPWSEVPPTRIVKSIRFVTADVALVDGSMAQFDSVLVGSRRVLFVMKKQGTEWRIFAFREINGKYTVPFMTRASEVQR